MRSSVRFSALLLGSTALLSACGSDSAPADGGVVKFSVASSALPAAVMGNDVALDVTSPAPGTYTDGTNTLVLTSVQMVLKKIELELAGEDANCHEAESGNSAVRGDRVGADIARHPGRAGPEQAVTVGLTAGTYDQIEFELRKPDDGNAADQAFVAANPDFNGVSVRVTGTFNGTPFTYTTEADAEQEHELNPPFTVAATGPATLTLMVDVSTWFQTGGTSHRPGDRQHRRPQQERGRQQHREFVRRLRGQRRGRRARLRSRDEEGGGPPGRPPFSFGAWSL